MNPVLQLPDWVERALAAAAAEAETPGWDGERGLSVAKEAWDDARAVLRSLALEALSPERLHVAASGDGYAHLTWFRPQGGRGTLEIGHGRFYWTVDGADVETLVTEPRSRAAAIAAAKSFIGS